MHLPHLEYKNTHGCHLVGGPGEPGAMEQEQSNNRWNGTKTINYVACFIALQRVTNAKVIMENHVIKDT